MKYEKDLELSHEINIDAPPNDLCLFFENLEENYKLWHPQDHIIFKWLGVSRLRQEQSFIVYAGNHMGNLNSKTMLLFSGYNISLRYLVVSADFSKTMAEND